MSLIFIVLMACASAFAHEGPLDELGCHVDPISSSYHCSKGPLKNLEFVSKEEAREAYEKLTADEFAVTMVKSDRIEEKKEDGADDTLTIVSWKLRKHNERLDYDRMARVLDKVQLVLFQEVSFNEMGDTPINVFSSVLEKRLGKRVCRGWVKNSRGERGRFAFVWLDHDLSAVTAEGQLQRSCGARPLVFRSDSYSSGGATFLLKSNGRLVHVASVHPEQDGRKAEHELTQLFRSQSNIQWATILAGNFKFAPKHAVFKEASRAKFQAALSGADDRENIWFKNLSKLFVEAINLKQTFPDVPVGDIETGLSPTHPIRIELSFAEENVLHTQIISRQKKSRTPAQEAPPILPAPSYPGAVSENDLSDLKEDFEAEQGRVEPAPLPAPTESKPLFLPPAPSKPLLKESVSSAAKSKAKPKSKRKTKVTAPARRKKAVKK